MKANARELFEVIRQVVRQEVKNVLPEMVRSHLTETYIKRMVMEAAGSKKPGLAELLTVKPDVDLEEIPEPLKNTDRGIYNPETLTKPENKKESTTRAVGKLAKDLGPLAFVLEGVKVPGEEGTTPDVPVDQINPDFERMSQLVEAADRAAVSKKQMSVSAESKMRELEMKRKALEIPVNGGKTG